MPACKVQSYVNDPAVLNVRLTLASVVALMLAGGDAPPAKRHVVGQRLEYPRHRPAYRDIHRTRGELGIRSRHHLRHVRERRPSDRHGGFCELGRVGLRCGADVRRTGGDCGDFPGLIHRRRRSAAAAPRHELRSVVADRHRRGELAGVADGQCERRRRSLPPTSQSPSRRRVWLQTPAWSGRRLTLL